MGWSLNSLPGVPTLWPLSHPCSHMPSSSTVPEPSWSPLHPVVCTWFLWILMFLGLRVTVEWSNWAIFSLLLVLLNLFPCPRIPSRLGCSLLPVFLWCPSRRAWLQRSGKRDISVGAPGLLSTLTLLHTVRACTSLVPELTCWGPAPPGPTSAWPYRHQGCPA